MADHETEKLTAPPDFQGPVGKRSCTDILCMLLLVITWGAMTYVGYTATQVGDYRLVLYPMDYDGNICGTNYGNIDMTEYKYLYPVNFYSGGVCVKECPQLSSPYVDLSTLVTYSGIFQPSSTLMDTQISLNNISRIPLDHIQIADYSNSSTFQETACTIQKCFPLNNLATAWSGEGINQGAGYAFYAVDTNPYMNRCVPSTEVLSFLEDLTTLEDSTSNKEEGEEWMSEAFSDIYVAKTYIAGFGLIFATIVGFIYAFLLQIPGVLVVMVWSSLLATIAMLGGIGYYAQNEALAWKNEDPRLHSDNQIVLLKGIGYALWVLGFLLFCLVCALRKRILLAIGVVREAAVAIRKMPLIIIFPILQCIGMFAFAAIWTIYTVFLASLGTIKAGQIEVNGVTVTVRDFEYDKQTEYQGWFLLFCFFWTSQFIIALGEIIIALSAAKWFFTRDKSSIGNRTVLKSIFQTLFFHTGTAAFGSLVIAVISMIRAILMYIQKKTSGTRNKVMSAILACLHCFMCCLEKFMKFLNKNAYIQTAIFGTSFCRSAKQAFFLILRNVSRVGTLSAISEIVVLIGKIFVAVVTAGCSYIFIDRYLGQELSSPVAPVIFVTFLSYFAGSMFMNVFSMVTSTILQCFIADEEMFGGTDESYSSETLSTWVESNGNKLNPDQPSS